MIPPGVRSADGLVAGEPMWARCSPTLDELLRRPPWHQDGACRTCGPEVTFFPKQGQPVGPAKEICAGCPVRDVCRTWALDQGDQLVGVWGGLSHIERQREQRRLRRLRTEMPATG